MKRQFRAFKGQRKAKILSAIAVVAALLATLWPLNPFPRNGVTWLSGMNGLRFQDPGLVISKKVLEPPETDDAQSYTLELVLQPTNMRSLRTILGFHSAVSARQLEIWQWKTGLLVTHDARVESDKTQEIKFGVDHVLEPGKLVCIAISSGRNGTRVYVDGQLAQSFPRFEISRNELSGSIILGTSPVRCDPWNGAIKGFAIYAKELMPEEAFQHYQSWTDRSGHSPADLDAAIARYRFEEGAGKEVHNQVSSGPNLEIPATFSVPYKGFLQSPVHEFRPSWKYAWEVVSNIAGFVPLGMVVCSQFAWTKTRWKAILTASAICATLSFAIEVLQYYIPRRGSGITDILTNTLGAVLGAILLQSSLVRKRMQMMGLVPAHQSAPQGE